MTGIALDRWSYIDRDKTCRHCCTELTWTDATDEPLDAAGDLVCGDCYHDLCQRGHGPGTETRTECEADLGAELI